MAFAGIAVSPVGDDYVASVSLVSKYDGSIIGNKTSCAPSPLSSLTKTIESLLLAVQDIGLKVCIFSISFALDADRAFEFHKAMEALETSSPLFIDPTTFHGETYIIGHPPKVESNRIVFVDFVSSIRFSVSFVQAKDNDGERQADIVHEERIFVPATSQANNVFLKAFRRAISSRRSQVPIERIVINNLASQAEFKKEIYNAIAAEYNDIPVVETTLEGIAEAAALSLYCKSLLPPREEQILAEYAIPLPVSIASISGSIITLVPPGYSIPCERHVTLTNSKDNQKSATIRFLLGNCPLAQDNMERAIVVLNDLKPFPRGEARIRVNIAFSHFDHDGWRDAATITVLQVGGPTKSYLFPRFLSGLPDNAMRNTQFLIKKIYMSGIQMK